MSGEDNEHVVREPFTTVKFKQEAMKGIEGYSVECNDPDPDKAFDIAVRLRMKVRAEINPEPTPIPQSTSAT